MQLSKSPISILALLLSLTFCSAADKPKDSKADNIRKTSYEQPQPPTENLDLTMYQRIRDEGLSHSHVMDYASALIDGIGPRLTGSPNLKRANEWTRDQFTAMGCSNAHLEDWGEFGMGWRQLNTWARMVSPDSIAAEDSFPHGAQLRYCGLTSRIACVHSIEPAPPPLQRHDSA
jgi:carboxypeptidase Q